MRLTGLMARLVLGGALVVAQAGCLAIPPAITIASLAVDVGSFAATGKTASDHVLSAVAGEDCRMLGVLEGEICREEQAFETALAVLEPLPEAPEQITPPVLQAEASLEPATEQEAETEQSSKPRGFKVPTGTVVTQEPELPIGGFAAGGKRITVNLASMPAPESQQSAAEPQEPGGLSFSGFLSDIEMLRAAPLTSAVSAESLDGAAFLAQAGPGLAPNSGQVQN